MTDNGSAVTRVLAALKPFGREHEARSWWLVTSNLALLAASAALAARAPWLALQLAAGVTEGLLLVRGFSFYHDAMHGSIFRRSPAGRALMWLYGMLVLTPPRVWRETHNYHHAHNGKLVGSQIGAYPVLTTEIWQAAGRADRWRYAAARHPLNIAFGYLSTFAYGMCLGPFLRSPRANWAGLLALAGHALLIAAAVHTIGVRGCWCAVLMPTAIATGVGSYLFYAQHNYEQVRIRERREWTFLAAGLEASSYMEAGPLWAWFTGNIGVHHVHHLNPMVPCYRLYEAMAGVKELQIPPNNSLRRRDVWGCLQLKLWDPAAARMVRFPPKAKARDYAQD